MSNEDGITDCHTCDGEGEVQAECDTCEGAGWINDHAHGGTMTCPDCMDEKDKCITCDGSGIFR